MDCFGFSVHTYVAPNKIDLLIILAYSLPLKNWVINMSRNTVPYVRTVNGHLAEIYSLSTKFIEYSSCLSKFLYNLTYVRSCVKRIKIYLQKQLWT